MRTTTTTYRRKRSIAGPWFERSARPSGVTPTERVPHGIPRTLHQVFGLWDAPGPLPANFSAWADKWRALHPGWSYVLWSGREVERLLAEERPEVRRVFDGFPRGAQRADLARYLILRRHGGIYADLDVECLRSLEPVLEAHRRASTVLFAEGSAGWASAWKLKEQQAEEDALPFYAGRVGNFAMATTARAPVLDEIIELVLSRSNAADASDADVLHMTGPGAVTDAVHAYRRGARDVSVFSARRTASYLCHRCTNTWVRNQDALSSATECPGD